MKKSSYLYGKNYDKKMVQEHIILFEKQIEWAKKTIEELQKRPLTVLYFDLKTSKYIDVPCRDLVRINHCLEAIKWNQEKINESKE